MWPMILKSTYSLKWETKSPEACFSWKELLILKSPDYIGTIKDKIKANYSLAKVFAH